MPNYKTHANFNILLALPAAAAGIYYLCAPPIPLLAVFAGTFCYSTLFMSPDLDLIHQIKLFSLRGLLTFPFRFYSKFFKHRGISHSFLFGTATRLLWLGGLSVLIVYLTYQVIPTEKQFLSYFNEYEPYVLYGLAGVVFADWCHLTLDFLKK